MLKRSDMTRALDLTAEPGAGPVRTRRPVYRDLLPPCNEACPAGEDIQAWLALAQAGQYRAAWEKPVAANPPPAGARRARTWRCKPSPMATSMSRRWRWAPIRSRP